jgi:hypothetical protein
MDSTQLKAAVRAEWASYVSNRVGPAPTPPTESMERWVRYNQALARYSGNFHGGITVAYNHGPAAFEAVIGALENAFQAAAGPSTRKPTFLGV